jgi:hypothetical protein
LGHNKIFIYFFISNLSLRISIALILPGLENSLDIIAKANLLPCRSYEELKALREISLVQLRRRLGEGGGGAKRTPATSPQGGGATAWLWGGWYSAPPSSPTAAAQPPPLTRAPPSPTAHQPPLTKGEEVFLQALQQESEVMGVAHKDVVFRQEAVIGLGIMSKLKMSAYDAVNTGKVLGIRLIFMQCWQGNAM